MTKLTEIAQDLLNLEINTIEKENMTAQKMPSTPHMLLDVSMEYLDFMISLGLDPRPYWQGIDDPLPDNIPKPGKGNEPDQAGEARPDGSEAGPRSAKPEEQVAIWTDRKPSFQMILIRNGETDFGHLRWLAYGLAVHPEISKRYSREAWDTHSQVLRRIVRNCDDLREMVRFLTRKSEERARWRFYLKQHDNEDDARGLNRREVREALRDLGPPPPLNISDATLLRKIWDVGTERIVLQTVIQIDGDVITRVRSDLQQRESKLLFDIHLQGVKTSVESWRYLLDIVRRFAEGALNALVGGGGRS